ncbi:hypothetical protein [uncultured Roseibium sp.]|uniref:hypothetical protein n=1 Tax=uncultured Roseibium sp. TaxID=1936171 RepID=UPI003217CBB2
MTLSSIAASALAQILDPVRIVLVLLLAWVVVTLHGRGKSVPFIISTAAVLVIAISLGLPAAINASQETNALSDRSFQSNFSPFREPNFSKIREGDEDIFFKVFNQNNFDAMVSLLNSRYEDCSRILGNSWYSRNYQATMRECKINSYVSSFVATLFLQLAILFGYALKNIRALPSVLYSGFVSCCAFFVRRNRQLKGRLDNLSKDIKTKADE